jgi:deoxyribonuclease IV
MKRSESKPQSRKQERSLTRCRPSTSEILLGAHMSTSGGVDKAIDRATGIGCSAMQIFVKSNMQWFAPAPFAATELRAFHEHAERAQLGAVFGHSGYMINLCATNPEFLAKSRRALAEELTRADQLRLPFLVLHPGAHMGEGAEAGLQLVVESLDRVFAKNPKIVTRVALETTAGQGSSLGSEFEHLAFILQNVREPERLCVCVDTAHLFAAGYDISTVAGCQRTFAKFDEIIGGRHLAALHLNDSKTPLGSRVDRHEHIGAGRIGLEGFRYIMTAPRFAEIPKVLETPKEKDLAEDVENLARLRELIPAPKTRQRSGLL